MRPPGNAAGGESREPGRWPGLGEAASVREGGCGRKPCPAVEAEIASQERGYLGGALKPEQDLEEINGRGKMFHADKTQRSVPEAQEARSFWEPGICLKGQNKGWRGDWSAEGRDAATDEVPRFQGVLSATP